MKETNKFAAQGIGFAIFIFAVANGIITFVYYGQQAYLIANAIVMGIGGITAAIGFAQKFGNSLHFEKPDKWRLWGFTGALEVLGLIAIIVTVLLFNKPSV